MKAKITTTIRADAEDMWAELQRVASLVHVAAPILTFRPQHDDTLPDRWTVGKTYRLRLYCGGILPLGDHHIRIVSIDPQRKEIFSNEHGRLTRRWNHLIRIVPIDRRSVEYTDEIEIEAGGLTVFIWIFAHVFYRHRQRRWKKLLVRRY
jgi:hypothetical protein